MMRVPGAEGSLLDAKAEGADVRMVYSPLDALRIARENPDREVVFFAIGFETTAPSTALTLKRAKAEGIPNFSCMCNHVLIVPPLRALLESPDLRLDRSWGPGTSRPWWARGPSSSSRPTTPEPMHLLVSMTGCKVSGSGSGLLGFFKTAAVVDLRFSVAAQIEHQRHEERQEIEPCG